MPLIPKRVIESPQIRPCQKPPLRRKSRSDARSERPCVSGGGATLGVIETADAMVKTVNVTPASYVGSLLGLLKEA
ncbi:hypothetical protein HRbin08_00920 [bacterium HR08]|nr:hypothetical protein HRbin08_00920 [bacterium HR08]